MGWPLVKLMGCILMVGLVFSFMKPAGAQTGRLDLKIEDVMTGQELKETGISGLTAPQRMSLDIWLNRYTGAVIKVATGVNPESPKPLQSKTGGGSDCVPAVESTIKGDF